MVMRRLALALLLPVLAAAPVPAATSTQAEVNAMLRDDERLMSGLLVASIIAHIVRHCDALEGPSRLARTAYFLSLYNRARSMGATREQIESFVEDEGERARVEDATQRYITQRGARPGDAETVCALGRAEMDAGTPIGRRLSER